MLLAGGRTSVFAQGFTFHSYNGPVSLTFLPFGSSSGSISLWDGGAAWVPFGASTSGKVEDFSIVMTADPGFVLTGFGPSIEDLSYQTNPFGGYFQLDLDVVASPSSQPLASAWNVSVSRPAYSGGTYDGISMGAPATFPPVQSVTIGVHNSVEIAGWLGGYYVFDAHYEFGTPVPEPQTYAWAAGLSLIGYAIWRRRGSKAAR